jgi:hypothetical protein
MLCRTAGCAGVPAVPRPQEGLLSPCCISNSYITIVICYAVLQAVLEFRLSRGPEKWRNVYKALLVSCKAFLYIVLHIELMRFCIFFDLA